MTSQGAANRRRGADAERAVVNYLKANGWPNARRLLAGDGEQYSDIDFDQRYSIEVKDVASSSWPSWRLQAVEQAGGRIPIVVRRTRGLRDVGAWMAHVPSFVIPFSYDHALWCRPTGMAWHVTTFGRIVATLPRPCHICGAADAEHYTGTNEQPTCANCCADCKELTK